MVRVSCVSNWVIIVRVRSDSKQVSMVSNRVIIVRVSSVSKRVSIVIGLL